jgi:uncharacterized delta-60 repeat protein
MKKIIKKKRVIFWAVAVIILGVCNSVSATREMDLTFNPGTGPNDYIYSSAIQSDGKIVILGPFTSYNGRSRKNIARLNADGTLDASFATGSGADIGLNSNIAIQSNGKILVGGDFFNYNGTAIKNIARLNTDGGLDTSFIPGVGPSSSVYAIAVQSDGKILIGGDFWSYSGTSRNGIARLNSNGTLDTSFDPGDGTDATVWSTSIQPDGKIIIAGDFATYDSVDRNGIARLNTDGSLDTSFDSSVGADNSVWATALQSDGKIVIGGYFTSYDGTSRNRIARLNSNGTLDSTFDPGSGFDSLINFNAIKIQSDGKIIATGNFTSYNGVNRKYVARLNADGTLDNDFNAGFGPDDMVNTADIQSDGDIIIGGYFHNYDGNSAPHIARIFLQAIPDSVTIDNPNAADMNGLVSSNYVTIDSGTVTEALQVTANTDIIMESNNVQLNIPALTRIINANSGIYNFENFTTENISATVVQDSPKSIAAIRVGISGTSLSFSQPVTLIINVGEVYNGTTMDVLYQNEGQTEWYPQTSCIVADGKCTFTTDHATKYAVEESLDDNYTPNVFTGKRSRLLSSNDTNFLKSQNFTFRGSVSNLKKGDIVQIFRDGVLVKNVKINRQKRWRYGTRQRRSTTSAYQFRYLDGQTKEEIANTPEYDIFIDKIKPKFTDFPNSPAVSPGDIVSWAATDNDHIKYYQVIFQGKKSNTNDASFQIPGNARLGISKLQVIAFDRAENKTIERTNIKVR